MSQDKGNVPDAAAELIDALRARSARVAVVGLGYVGLPMVRALHDAGHRVIGFDIDPAKIDALREGRAYLKHLGGDLPRTLAESDRFTPTCDSEDLSGIAAAVLCVPTPLGEARVPDLSFVERSTAMIAPRLGERALVVLVSTTYPGTTRSVVAPILSMAGRDVERDTFVVFSPEREDPGRAGVTTRQIPRLVGGLDETSLAVGLALFEGAVERVIAVSSAEVAESAKLLENVYRAVNIALVNELKPVLEAMGIDIWEVIEAAATKPYGFSAFYPGPGLGGHCIPIDPFYLSWLARSIGQQTRFIELAGEVNSRMPRYVVDRVEDALGDRGTALHGAGVLVLGIAYKPDVDDIRESPAAEIIEQLQERGADVSYHDPHIPVFPSMRRFDIKLGSVALTPDVLAAADAVVIVTNHTAVDYALVGRHSRLIIDTRNAMAGIADVRAAVVKA